MPGMSDSAPKNVQYPKVKQLSMEEMQGWAQEAFQLQGDRSAERTWAQKALKLFVKESLASYKSDLEEARAKALFLAMVTFYYEFWGIFWQAEESVNYYDWAENFKESGHWIGHLAKQRGLRTEESDEDDQEDALAEDLEALANDLRGEMLAGFKGRLGNPSEIFLFFYSACGEDDRDEILGVFDPDRQAAFDFVSSEVGP